MEIVQFNRKRNLFFYYYYLDLQILLLNIPHYAVENIGYLPDFKINLQLEKVYFHIEEGF